MGEITFSESQQRAGNPSRSPTPSYQRGPTCGPQSSHRAQASRQPGSGRTIRSPEYRDVTLLRPAVAGAQRGP